MFTGFRTAKADFFYFGRYGYRVMNGAEITKYKTFYPESVYLNTVIKNLETAEPLAVDIRSRS